jgi:hypothetical protein
MLVFKDMSVEKAQEGQWFDRVLWGSTVRFKIRPRTGEIIKSIKDKFEDMKDGQKKEEAIEKTVWEHVFESFAGIAEESGGTVQDLEVTYENKKKILNMEVPFGEQSNTVWILNKANNLAFKITEDQVGNL